MRHVTVFALTAACLLAGGCTVYLDATYEPTGNLPAGLARGAQVHLHVVDNRSTKIVSRNDGMVSTESGGSMAFFGLSRPSRDTVEDGFRRAMAHAGYQLNDAAPLQFHVDLKKFEAAWNSGFNVPVTGTVALDCAVRIKAANQVLATRHVEKISTETASGGGLPAPPVAIRALARSLALAVEDAATDATLLTAARTGRRAAVLAGPLADQPPIVRPGPPPAPLLTTEISQRWAVIIGVAQYKNVGESLEALRYADRDAIAFRDFLVSKTGGRFPPSHVMMLTNEQATTRNVRKAMFTFLKQAIKEDLVIVYFSGHGASDPDRPKNLYMLTYDTDPKDIAATAFPMDDVKKALANTVEAQRVVVLADACHSGGVAHATAAKGVRIGQQNEAVNRYWSQLSKTAPGRVIFTSSERSEVSQESAKWGGGHGVFTFSLLEGLKGAADYDSNGIVTVGEAIRYTDEKVRRETRSAQHPAVAGERYDPNLPMGVVK